MAGLEPTISESKSGVLPLHYISITKGGIWGSNPRHPEPQSGALPTELIPPYNTPRGIRTPDTRLRRPVLYPAELLALLAERVKGIEPSYPAWKAGVLPLNYTRIFWGFPFISPKILSYRDTDVNDKIFFRKLKKALTLAN